MGFFSSESLAALAPGLATFIDNPTSPFRLIVCPLLKQEDQAALKEGVSQSDAAIIAANAIRETLNTEDFIKRHTLKCLAWLLAAGRIEIKIALMREGLFHPKVWLFLSRTACPCRSRLQQRHRSGTSKEYRTSCDSAILERRRRKLHNPSSAKQVQGFVERSRNGLRCSEYARSRPPRPVA